MVLFVWFVYFSLALMVTGVGLRKNKTFCWSPGDRKLRCLMAQSADSSKEDVSLVYALSMDI